MNRPILKRILLPLFGVWCVVYFAGTGGVTWTITAPTNEEEIPKASNIGGHGTGPLQTNYLFKFLKNAEMVTQVAGTTTAVVEGQIYGNWSSTLVPPAAAPYNSQWPPSPTTKVAIYEGGAEKESRIVIITGY
jgi:hypothetical protein